MPRVYIHTNSFVAKVAAKMLRFSRIAITIGNNVYLHNATAHTFLNTQRWLIHELKHVEQYEQEGFIGFLFAYLRDALRNGYYQNKFEIEARHSENEVRLLKKYEVCII